MPELEREVEPDQAGFDPARLDRIGPHFRRSVDAGLLPGWSLLVSRGGEIVHLDCCGRRDLESGAPFELDTVVRLYSMTKPVTSVAAMMLYEEGAFELRDPVSRFIPSFAEQRVYRSGSALNPGTDRAVEPVRIWHLLTHTAGLTYGFHHASAVDEMYRRAGYEMGAPAGVDLATACDTWAGLPLLFEPGSEWNYSVATDVLGRVVEAASGQSLDRFFAERIFEPLGMHDTAFWASEEQADRLAALYSPAPGDQRAVRNIAMGARGTAAPAFLSGGGGLVGTLADYHRFTQLLLRGGELDGVRLLGSRTLDYMTRNHLPANADLTEFGRPIFSEVAYDGIGFGLGFSVVIDAARAKVLCSEGEFAWGGAASTAFWVDPAEEITAVFLTQLLPSSTHPIRTQLRQLVYQALVD
ncbi:MAG: serine hydrolase domain-containing protein [Acidimicrobiales bacterium]